jgi:hypothetical protein
MHTQASSTSARRGAVFFPACALFLICCGGTADPGDPAAVGAASTPVSAAQAPRPSPAADCEDAAPPAADAASAADAGYFGCTSDDDCVAGPVVSDCCSNGWLIAVARDEVAAYEKATACTTRPPHICPEYVMIDLRVPACVEDRCTMVQPPSQAGSSGTPNAHWAQ